MKKSLRLGILVVAAIALAVAGANLAMAGGKHCMGKAACATYDAKTTGTFEGKVVSVESEKCEGCGEVGVHVMVQMKDGEVSVHLGPAWFIDNQDEKIAKDDVIEVFGSKVTENDSHFVIAAKVKKGDDTLVLRDDKGLPVWRGWRRAES